MEQQNAGARLGAPVRRSVRSLARGLSLRTPPGRRRAAALVFVVAVGMIAIAFGRDLSPQVVTDWADRAGWWFPAAFIVFSGIVCVAPVPRTAFTVAAGVLFPPVWAVVVALAGAVLAAFLTFAAGRALGRDAVKRRLTHPAARSVDERLRRRGWLAVGSLRLIPVVPFSVLSYCCSVSGVRMVPYLAATAVGSLPGTIAVVCFSDALTGGAGWISVAMSAVAVGLGLTGLAADHLIDRRSGVGPVHGGGAGADADDRGAGAVAAPADSRGADA